MTTIHRPYAGEELQQIIAGFKSTAVHQGELDPTGGALYGRLAATLEWAAGMRAANAADSLKSLRRGLEAGCEACAQHVEGFAETQASPNSRHALRQLASNFRQMSKEAEYQEITEETAARLRAVTRPRSDGSPG